MKAPAAVTIDTVCLVVIAFCSVILTIHLTQVGGVVFTVVATVLVLVVAVVVAGRGQASVTRDEIFAELLRVTKAANELLDAMDRQHGDSPFSINVNHARGVLADVARPPRAQDDEARRVA